MSNIEFRQFFTKAMGEMAEDRNPYHYQEMLAQESWPHLLNIPTGLGKTAAIVLTWLYKRRILKDQSTPRRLVYCLPMRVLVEQTATNVRDWLNNLLLPDQSSGGQVSVHILRGGETPSDWDLEPERECVVIGTQDMLLSRALNRGYGMSRYRWPMHFGLLNNDAMWVFDEVQLMGAGLATTSQLHAFRDALGAFSETRSLWMSATLDRDWLRTVDLDPATLGEPLQLSDEDKARSPTYSAPKPLRRTRALMGDSKALAEEVLNAHQAGSRTLVIVNTVARAVEIQKHLQRQKPTTEIVLIHSRFRPPGRAEKVERLLAEPGPQGTIIVSTQVVEAGVDVSARVLFAELAPWASLVQRFGRCNRRGEYDDSGSAQVYWLDLPEDEKKRTEVALPYALDELIKARELLARCDRGVGPDALASIEVKLDFTHGHVIRRKDLIELFDTTADLAGNDIDIDRYVRDSDSSDVLVFWRDFVGAPEPEEPMPAREELCRAPIGSFKLFIEKLGPPKHPKVFRRNFPAGAWETIEKYQVYPGQMYMLAAAAGGYDSDLGWTGQVTKSKASSKVHALARPAASLIRSDDSNDREPYSEIGVWQRLSEHSSEAHVELEAILRTLDLVGDYRVSLLTAIRWHDLGKCHWVFRHALPDGVPDPLESWAKAKGKWKRYLRRHFRHELASALAVLQERDGHIPHEQRDLIAYLIAAHHGKVRLSIRSMPDEKRPADAQVRFARGVWDNDELPQTDLGGGVIAPKVTLSLEPTELGLSDEGEPSWSERMLRLRDDSDLGPFRLAYLEALLRAADMRVSSRAAELQP